MAPLFGIDVSHHQGAINWRAVRDSGIRFVGIKATEGDSFVDPMFKLNLAGARSVGLLPFAYHYQRSVASPAEQVANVVRTVPKDCPVAMDVEAGSGLTLATSRIVSGLRSRGYRVPLSYIPRWYWQQLGMPDLHGLPPLWSSRYPDMVVRDIADTYQVAYTRLPIYASYGGLSVEVAQFSSCARVTNRLFDADAFPGTVAQLRDLLYGPPEVNMASVYDILDQKVGTDANDALRDRYKNRPGTLGHYLLHNGDDITAVRDIVEQILKNQEGTP